MADADARLAQPRDLPRVEMNAVGEPDAARHPAGFLEEVDRPQAIHLEAEALFVLGLAEMGVKLAVVALGQARALGHEILRDRERRTGRERDADLGARLRIVEELQHPLAVGEDCLLVLDDAVRRQAAVLLREVHRAARDGHPHAKAQAPPRPRCRPRSRARADRGSDDRRRWCSRRAKARSARAAPQPGVDAA